jgi:hypothetical protein
MIDPPTKGKNQPDPTCSGLLEDMSVANNVVIYDYLSRAEQ